LILERISIRECKRRNVRDAVIGERLPRLHDLIVELTETEIVHIGVGGGVVNDLVSLIVQLLELLPVHALVSTGDPGG